MKKIRLGKTGLMVSRVGIGGIPLTRPTEEDAIKVVHRALELGINFIDTAWGYMPSQERIGKALVSSAVPRESLVLCTRTHVQDKETALKHVDESLSHLQTDYIDIWQLHNVSNWKKYRAVMAKGGALEAAQEAQKAGKIHQLGISGHNLEVMLEAAKTGLFDVIQFPLNFISNEALPELLPYTIKQDIGFIAMKPFGGGALRKANLSIKYLLQFDSVVPDPGVEKIEEIEEIAAIVNSGFRELSNAEKKEIEQLKKELGKRFCRQCQYCMPCPQEIQIALLLIIKRMYTLWPYDDFTETMDGIVEAGSNCTQCGECEKKCPYELPIPEMIRESVEFFERVTKK